MSGFPCTGCGACCKRVGLVVSILSKLDPDDPNYFPYGTKEDGMTCEKLGEGNRCEVYEDRPTVCNIGKMQKIMGYNKKRYFKSNAEQCNEWVKEDGLGDEFLVKFQRRS